MADFYSQRFGKNVWVTRHARKSMLTRGIEDAELRQLIELGQLKRKDDVHVWIYMHIQGRADNLMCAAASDSTALIIKTVMVNWELEDET